MPSSHEPALRTSQTKCSILRISGYSGLSPSSLVVVKPKSDLDTFAPGLSRQIAFAKSASRISTRLLNVPIPIVFALTFRQPGPSTDKMLKPILSSAVFLIFPLVWGNSEGSTSKIMRSEQTSLSEFECPPQHPRSDMCVIPSHHFHSSSHNLLHNLGDVDTARWRRQQTIHSHRSYHD